MAEDIKFTLKIVTIGFVFVGGLATLIIKSGNQVAAETRRYLDWKHQCIDAGGTPVTLLEYVKSVGDGQRCIKSVEVVELK